MNQISTRWNRILLIIVTLVTAFAFETGAAFGASTGVHYVAHRGYAYQARENTAKAFVLAGKHHFWSAECDIYETKHDRNGDFDLVLHHDNTFHRIYGNPRKVRSMTAEQMRNSFSDITFFEEYLDICAKYGMRPLVEYKDKDMSDAAIRRSVDLLYEKGLLESAYMQSFHMSKLKKVRSYIRTQYHIEPAMIYLIEGSSASVYRKVKKAHENNIDRVSIRKNKINKKVYKYCRKNGMRISAWTFHQNWGKRYYRADKKLIKKLVRKYHIEMAIVESKGNGF